MQIVAMSLYYQVEVVRECYTMKRDGNKAAHSGNTHCNAAVHLFHNAWHACWEHALPYASASEAVKEGRAGRYADRLFHHRWISRREFCELLEWVGRR